MFLRIRKGIALALEVGLLQLIMGPGYFTYARALYEGSYESTGKTLMAFKYILYFFCIFYMASFFIFDSYFINLKLVDLVFELPKKSNGLTPNQDEMTYWQSFVWGWNLFFSVVFAIFSFFYFIVFSYKYLGIDFMVLIGSGSSNRNGRYENLEDVKAYVKRNNNFKSRGNAIKGSLEVAKLDSLPEDEKAWLNRKFNWMSRENSFKYIKNGGKK